ncbi:hypothetical protein M885DRAFT_143934 [Pelagophyceae sp. CCMP2097]|nr:hypothetical protein M885DRAFT_143934 [Pelagophyceae sp. CCMP2097]
MPTLRAFIPSDERQQANGFLFMNFSVDEQLTESIFGVDSQRAAWLYSMTLIMSVPCFFAAADCFTLRGRGALGLWHVLNLACAVQRFAAVHTTSYALALASSIPLGVSTSLMIASYGAVTELWLPEEERALGMSILVQSNYSGWLAGAVLTPIFAKDRVALVYLLQYQVAACTMAGAFAALELASRPYEASAPKGYKAPPAPDVVRRSPQRTLAPGGEREVAAREAEEAMVRREEAVQAANDQAILCDDGCAAPEPLSLYIAVKDLAANPRWLVLGLCYATVGGIGYAIPAAQDAIFFAACPGHLDAQKNARANGAFILAGVLTVITLGRYGNALVGHEAAVLTPLLSAGAFVIGLLALALARGVCYEGLVLPLMALAGASSLGFVGLALREAAETAAPNKSASLYSSGLIVWGFQGTGALFTQVASNRWGFTIIAASQAISAVGLVVGFRMPRKGAQLETRVATETSEAPAGF